MSAAIADVANTASTTPDRIVRIASLRRIRGSYDRAHFLGGIELARHSCAIGKIAALHFRNEVFDGTTTGQHLYGRDCFDLEEEIWICQSAQHTEGARRWRVTKIFLQDRARFGHVMRIADVDRHLHDVLQTGT